MPSQVAASGLIRSTCGGGARLPFARLGVADASALSALTTSGFLHRHDAVAETRRLWAPHLGEFHLPRGMDAASALAGVWSDERLAGDHAPTLVYEIRLAR